jgi:hypothetical protein
VQEAPEQEQLLVLPTFPPDGSAKTGFPAGSPEAISSAHQEEERRRKMRKKRKRRTMRKRRVF